MKIINLAAYNARRAELAAKRRRAHHITMTDETIKAIFDIDIDKAIEIQAKCSEMYEKTKGEVT